MTAATTTVHAGRATGDGRALWARLAFLLGGAVIGISATAIIVDTDDTPARSVTTVDAGFRDASAAEADRYVDVLERRAAAQLEAQRQATVAAAGPHRSPDAAERTALAEENAPSDSCGVSAVVTRC